MNAPVVVHLNTETFRKDLNGLTRASYWRGVTDCAICVALGLIAGLCLAIGYVADLPAWVLLP